MITLEEYFDSFKVDVRASSEAVGEYPRNTFTTWAIERLTEANEVFDLVQAPYSGVGKNRRQMAIDAFGFDSLDGTFVAMISSYEDEESLETITRSEIEKSLGQLRFFIETCLNVNEFRNFPNYEEAVSAGQLLLENKGAISKFKFYLVTNKMMSSRVTSLPNDELNGVLTEYSVWDFQRFYDAFSSTQGREQISIDFTKWYPGGLPALSSSSSAEGVNGTYLCIIRGEVLAEIFDTFGSRLLEGNVRTFLSARGGINKGIRQTIISSPQKFLAFNNGITATATSVETASSSSGYAIFKIMDLQIVNGGQTTASLHDYFKKEKDHGNLELANVQMKLLDLDPSHAEEMVSAIARYSNSQNKVSEADFFSNSSFHRKIEQMSKRISANPVGGSQIPTYWFYERARGAFVNERARAANQKQFDLKYPKSQLITKTDLAKYYNSWAQLPHQVSAGAQKNFLAFASKVADNYVKDEAAFGDKFFRELICKAILFKALDKSVKQSEWSSGYAANTVTYAIAKFSSDLDKENLTLDWDSIWRKQTLSSALIDYLTSLAKFILSALEDPRRPKQNVTEWAKDPNCWKAIAQLEFHVPKTNIGEIIDFNENSARAAMKEDRAVGRDLTAAEKMTFIHNLDLGTWDKIANNPPGTLRVSPDEKSIIKRLIRNRVLNSEFEYSKLFELLARAQGEGMVIPDFDYYKNR